MTFRGDDRGVTVQVGAVLFFAALVVAMSLYQAAVVPGQNHEVEFDHSQRAQGDMQDVRNAVLRTGATGNGQPVSVDLGERYAARTFFVNPPPVSGSLRTTAAREATVENATALSDETADYWNGTTHSVFTQGLVYTPDYHEYGNAPVTHYENTVAFNDFDSANVTLTEQGLVHGRTVTLVALNGSLSKAQVGTVSVDPTAVSPSTTPRTVSVRRSTDGEPVTIRVPTALSESKWDDLLSDQRYVEDSYVEDGSLVVVLQETKDGSGEPLTYDLRMAKVGVGAVDGGTNATYLTGVRGDTELSTEETTTLVAEVRDEFNNPVSGVTVNATVDGGPEGRLDATSATTGEGGRVRFTYTAPNGEKTETVTLHIGDEEYERVEYEIQTTEASGGGGGNGAYDVEWVAGDGTGLDCDDDVRICYLNASKSTSATFTASVANGATSVASANVDYGFNDSSVVREVSPGNATTDAGGRASTTLDVKRANGTVELYAASGGDADAVTVHVNTSDGAPAEGPTASLTIAKIEEGPGNSDDTYEFDASGSSGDIEEHKWDFNDDGVIEETTSTATATTEIKPSKLPETARVVVVDSTGKTDEATAPYDSGSREPSTSYPSAFDDGDDDSRERNENGRIPPWFPLGDVQRFGNLDVDSSGNRVGIIRDRYGWFGSRMSSGVAISSIESRDNHELVLGDYRVQGSELTVTPVYANGTTIDRSFTISESSTKTRSIDLPPEVVDYINDEGTLYLLFEDEDGNSDNRLRIDYIAVKSTDG